MRVLVTGAGGKIGAHFARSMHDNGMTLVLTDLHSAADFAAHPLR